MKTVSELIYQILHTYTGVVAVVGDKIFPLLADQDSEVPFIVYLLSEEPVYSKFKKNSYGISVVAYHTNYNALLDLSAQIKAAFEASPAVFRYEGSEPQFNVENLYSIAIRYNYKQQ